MVGLSDSKKLMEDIPNKINDRLVIANDCVFPEDWTVNDLLKEHKSRPYNPNIAAVFYRAGLIESWGRGINSIGESCKASGNKKPEYDVKHTVFCLVWLI